MAAINVQRVNILFVCSLVGLSALAARQADTLHIPYSVFLQGGITGPVTPNVYCLDDVACPPFGSGIGSSVDFMIATRFTLADDLSLITGLGGGLWTTTMHATDAAGRTRDALGNVVPFVREQTLDARSTYISACANIAYAIGDLRFSVGPRIELGLGAPTWQQTSRIVSPTNILYPDGTKQIVSVAEQAISEASPFRVSAMLVTEYHVSLSATTSLAPYLAISYTPTSVRYGGDWTDARLALGISFHSIFDYIRTDTPRPIEPAPITEHEPNIVSMESTVMTTEPAASTEEPTVTHSKPTIALRRQGATNNDVIVQFTTQEQSQTFGVLPFVFFDSASAVIPTRYKLPHSINQYDAAVASSDQHSLYLEILNVIGSRMRSGTDSIIVQGYADSSSEHAACLLAERRAQSVKDFIVKTWGIAPQRIAMATSPVVCMPMNASPSSSAEGRAENRRVEILMKNHELFMPVVRRDVAMIIDSDLDSLEASVGTSSDTVRHWITRLRQGDEIVHEHKHMAFNNTTMFSIPRNVLAKLHVNRPVQLQIIGFTRRGDTLECTVPVSVVFHQAQQRIRTLALSMFEFGRSSLTRRDSLILNDFARQLQSGEVISIHGYTDKFGSATYNDALSSNRAVAVADHLRRVRPDCRIAEIRGHGARRFPQGLDSYELPEQRFMCRTVQLEVTAGR